MSETGIPHIKENFSGNPRERLEVTGRNFSSVKRGLSLNITSIPHHARVLVLGEGFSDFSLLLQRKRPDLSLITADPMYAYAKPADPQDMILKKLEKAGYAPDIVTFLDKERSRPQEGEKIPSYIAADIYALPLADSSVDQIYMNHVLEHIDLAKAVPELLRVLKPGGEIRFGGVAFTHFQVEEGGGNMYLGMLKVRYGEMDLDGPELSTLQRGFDLLGKHPEVMAYGYVPEPYLNKRGTVRTFVIIKGDSLPVFSNKEQDVGTMMKLHLAEINEDALSYPYIHTEIPQRVGRIEKIIEEIKNPDREGAPEIELGGPGKQELKKLIDRLKETEGSEGGRHVIVVVRCFNKSKESLQGLLAKLQQMRHSMPELRGYLYLSTLIVIRMVKPLRL